MCEDKGKRGRGIYYTLNRRPPFQEEGRQYSTMQATSKYLQNSNSSNSKRWELQDLGSFVPKVVYDIKVCVFSLPSFPFVKQNRQAKSRSTAPPPGGSRLLSFFGMAIGEGATIGIGNTVSDTIGSVLEAFYGRLLVRINIELDEQEQVAGQDTASHQGSSLGAGAVSHVRQVPRRRRVARVCAEVDREEINHKLGDLHGGQVFLPPNLLATGGCVVIVIHANVNRKIERNDNPGDAGTTIELGEAQESSDGVVIHMQESEWLLLQDKEDGIEELEVFEKVVDNIKEF